MSTESLKNKRKSFDEFVKESTSEEKVITEKSLEENNSVLVKTEILDSRLITALAISAGIYFLVYTLGSIIAGDAFGGFIATPLGTISFFITSRWDRLRDSKSISLKYMWSLLNLDWKNIILTFVLIFSLQFIIGVIHTFYLIVFQNSYYRAVRKLDYVERMMADWQTLVFTVLMAWATYFVAGYFSARYAIRKGKTPYKHAVLSTSIYYFVSVSFMSLLYNLSTGKQLIPNEASVGFKVLTFLQFIIMPMIGARLAVRKNKTENKLKQ